MAVLIGEGTLLQIGDGGTPTEVFTTVAQRISIDGPERTTESVKTTDLDSEAQEKRPGEIPDNGEVSLTANFDPANTTHGEIEDFLETVGLVNWRIVFNNKTNSRPHRQFSGFVKSFKYAGMEENGNLQFEITIDISGKITKGTTTIA